MQQLSEQLYQDWTFVVPRFDEKMKIIHFDDGNNEFKDKYTNEWVIFGEWKGKVALFNNQEQSVVIKSISLWKLSPI